MPWSPRSCPLGSAPSFSAAGSPITAEPMRSGVKTSAVISSSQGLPALRSAMLPRIENAAFE